MPQPQRHFVNFDKARRSSSGNSLDCAIGSIALEGIIGCILFLCDPEVRDRGIAARGRYSSVGPFSPPSCCWTFDRRLHRPLLRKSPPALLLPPGPPRPAAQDFFKQGNEAARLNKWDQAIAAYKKALALKPGYVEAHYNLGNAYAAEQETKPGPERVSGSAAPAPGLSRRPHEHRRAGRSRRGNSRSHHRISR